MTYYDRRNEARRISILASRNASREIRMTEFEKGLEKFSKTKDIGEWGALVEKGGIRLYDEIAKEFKDWKAPKPLPAIPQYVATTIKECKIYEISLYTVFKSGNYELVKWLNEDTFRNSELLARAWLEGYTIEEEEEKKYYLKNTMTQDYLYKNGKYFAECEKNTECWKTFETIFTQDEIDNMDNLGSYEKIEVVE